MLGASQLLATFSCTLLGDQASPHDCACCDGKLACLILCMGGRKAVFTCAVAPCAS